MINGSNKVILALNLLTTNFYNLCIDIIQGTLTNKLEFNNNAMIGIYLVPNGYPTNSQKNYDIYIDNTINSEKGIDMNMNENLINLLGKVEIFDISGRLINTSDLIIDQSKGREIYKSNEPSHFQSDSINIKAKKMYYDANTKKLELIGNVLAVYE